MFLGFAALHGVGGAAGVLGEHGSPRKKRKAERCNHQFLHFRIYPQDRFPSIDVLLITTLRREREVLLNL